MLTVLRLHRPVEKWQGEEVMLIGTVGSYNRDSLSYIKCTGLYPAPMTFPPTSTPFDELTHVMWNGKQHVYDAAGKLLVVQ